jgi:GNAT superfamily N-acetyltransferase
MIRLLCVDDIPAIMDIQSLCYSPDLCAKGKVFKNRLEACPGFCRGVELHDKLIAYAIAHPWSGDMDLHRLTHGSIPKCDCTAGDNEYLYLADIAVHPNYRNLGYAGELLNKIQDLAQYFQLPIIKGMAVQGAHKVWARYGFTVGEKTDLWGIESYPIYKDLRETDGSDSKPGRTTGTS